MGKLEELLKMLTRYGVTEFEGHVAYEHDDMHPIKLSFSNAAVPTIPTHVETDDGELHEIEWRGVEFPPIEPIEEKN